MGVGVQSIAGTRVAALLQIAEELDSALSRYADVLKRDLGQEVKDVPGAGAAGGLGAGLIAFLHARLRPGVDLVLYLRRDAFGL